VPRRRRAARRQHLAAHAPLNGTAGVAAYALDPDDAERLWDLSLAVVA
jgi:hypothetical protein